jgi:hypothetical protein
MFRAEHSTGTSREMEAVVRYQTLPCGLRNIYETTHLLRHRSEAIF